LAAAIWSLFSWFGLIAPSLMSAPILMIVTGSL
jgi:hypothetical protein